MSEKNRDRGGALLPEWPHRIEAASIGDAPVHVRFTATPEQRRDLARRLRIESIEEVQAEAVLVREKGGGRIHVTGRVQADISQPCVSTLESIRSRIDERFDAWFSDQSLVVNLSKVRRERGTVDTGAAAQVMSEQDDPEPVEDGWIDVGELAAQYLSLAIDPYPRSENAPNLAEVAPTPVANPFAALKNWKESKK